MKKWLHIVSSLIFAISMQSLIAQEILCIENSVNDFTITWSVPAAPCGPFVSYEIWVANQENGTYTLAGTVNNELQTSFTHVNATSIGDPLYYYIVYNYNCPGVPPIISTTTTNAFSNYQPEIVSLDVSNNGIEICWDESEFVQTCGYVISYLLPNGLAQPFDTVFGITNTCYLDVVSNINDPNLVYTLSYIDCCNNLSQYNDIGYQILSISSDQQGCNQLIEYEWQPYNNPYNLDFTYSVYIQVNDNTIDTIDSIPNNQNLLNFFDFVDQDTINVQVEVVDENGVNRSNSPWLTDTAQIVQPPRYFYIYYLSVVNNNFIDIDFNIDTLSELRNLQIDTSKYNVDFDYIERYDATLFPNLGNINLPDTVSPPYNYARYYRITANDSCNDDHLSTVGRTIYTEAKLFDFFKNDIEWTAFELENAVVSAYRLYRDYGAGMQLVTTFYPGDALAYTDDVSEFFNQQGTFCYRVEADYTFTHPDGMIENFTTQSNISCIEERPILYVPNAIVPNGTNNEFKPYILFGSPTAYSMKIFNRWGELLFESNDVNSGWFGTKNDSPVPTGGYPYIIQFTASDGRNIEKKGIVTVIR